MKDWKIVFNTRNYHYIFVKTLYDEDYLHFFYEHQKEIELEPSFFIMMPSQEDLNIYHNQENNGYVKKFAPLLKSFMESTSKTTLITEENIVKSIIKEEKRANFFRYLSKNKKNIVLFSHSDLEQYTNSDEFSLIKMTREDIERQYHLFDRFGDIKDAIKKTYNPFKNPQEAFEKIQGT
jgi:hypothetical protein